MPYYITCPYCGFNLDPGEKCECQKVKESEIKIRVSSKRDSRYERIVYQVKKGDK